MEIELPSKPYNDDIEEGELSDDSDGYTPLQRPESSKTRLEPMVCNSRHNNANSVGNQNDDSDFGCSTPDSSSDSDDCMKASTHTDPNGIKKKKSKRSVLLRVLPTNNDNMEQKKSRFKKYDIWTASLQEESLMENMRGIDVARSNSDRNVENYDYSLKYHVSETGDSLKRRRRMSTSSCEDMVDFSGSHSNVKRIKPAKGDGFKDHRSIKDRLGSKKGRRHSRREGGSSSSCDSQTAPRIIPDLNITDKSENHEIAREIANKLYEKKDDLLLKIVDVLDKTIPIEIFKETQRIEKDGGMMIMNGQRRRTPGGVFLFLLKHHDQLTATQKKEIFEEERKKLAKDIKSMQAINRDKKVEELKKQLSKKEKQLITVRNRSECSSHLKPTEPSTLPNPPPSPVASFGQEYSPEYKSHAINHVNDCSPDKLRSHISSNDDESLTAYDDDFLDMNCDMDLF